MVQIDDLRAWCLGLNGVKEDIKWGHDLCFCVAEKMFLVVALDEQPVSASFKLPPDQYEELVHKHGFAPAPYMARHHWILIDDVTRLTRKDWEKYILQSYDLVVNKLPKRIKTNLLSSGG